MIGGLGFPGVGIFPGLAEVTTMVGFFLASLLELCPNSAVFVGTSWNTLAFGATLAFVTATFVTATFGAGLVVAVAAEAPWAASTKHPAIVRVRSLPIIEPPYRSSHPAIYQDPRRIHRTTLTAQCRV